MSGRAFQRARLGRRLAFAAALGAVGCGIGIVGSEPPPVSDADAGRERLRPVACQRADGRRAFCGGTHPTRPRTAARAARSPTALHRRDRAPDRPVVLPPTAARVAVNGNGPFASPSVATTRAELDGGSPTGVLTADGATRQIAVDDDYLWYTSTSLWRASMDGGAPVSIALGSSARVSVDPSKSAVDAADVEGDRIIAVPYEGGLASDLLTADAGVASPWGVAANATDVFFTSSGDAGSLSKHPKDGGGGTTTLKTGQANPNCLTFDEDGLLYWVNNGDGTIHRSKADGTEAIVLATGQTAVTQLAIDAKFYYWGTGNAVRRLAR